MTINMWIATLAWCCLALGYIRRADRVAHSKLMLAGITADITLVLYLQFTRNAIQKAIGPGLELLHRLHIASSTLALLLYFPVLYFGFQLLRKGSDPDLLRKHKKLAVPALLCRTVGLLLMFSLLHSR